MRKITKQNADKLRDWRKSLDITQEQAADRLNVPLPTYRNWEQMISSVPGPVWAYLNEVL